MGGHAEWRSGRETIPRSIFDVFGNLANRSQPFSTEAKRMEFLFELYEKYTADLFTKEKPKKSKKK